MNPIGPARGGERRVRVRPSAAVDGGDGAAGRQPHRQRRRQERRHNRLPHRWSSFYLEGSLILRII